MAAEQVDTTGCSKPSPPDLTTTLLFFLGLAALHTRTAERSYDAACAAMPWDERPEGLKKIMPLAQSVRDGRIACNGLADALCMEML